MPTKQPDDTIALSPALHYLLMTGAHATCRIHGWVALSQVPVGDLDRHVREAWAEHGEALTAEARGHGFEPCGVGRRRPRGAAVDAWAASFLAEHRY